MRILRCRRKFSEITSVGFLVRASEGRIGVGDHG